MRSLKAFIILVSMAGLWGTQAQAQKSALSTVTNFNVSGGFYSFDVYATRTSTSNILVGTTNFIVNTNRAGLSTIGMTLTNINASFSGGASHLDDYDPMRIDTIVGAANAGKVAVTIVFTGNSSGAGAPLANTAAPGTMICTIRMPIINPTLRANLRWDVINSALTDSRSQPVANSFAGSDSSVLGPTSVSEVAPKVFALFQNYPNPFNPESVIKFSVEKSGRATLNVYSILGQKVATLYDGIAEAGQYYHVRLAGQNLASGTYIYRLQSGSQSDVKKLLLLK